ncbi:FUSC family protein [Neoroseomonas lacus]|uniref:FUSC family protein n=1 Tax=Neoroseomonas lacus TaxID=287609 RepID=A0A917NPZ5_9PROT|nr:FUSC family protein [Neoroseomonas lacus]GGJ17381.1 hypothetical protein GCM10011320_25900 [Neoroseomonas lacus]
MSSVSVPVTAGRWADGLRAAVSSKAPALMFGLRLWASISLSLYLAFWLELDGPALAATSAAFVCQPQLGASLRKGWFRMIGTVAGAVVAVALTAAFPQDRIVFLTLVALWGGACALAATLLRNFASYAAALAGFTAAFIVSDQLGATGGPNGAAFILAVNRVSEVCLGIACAGVIQAVTDLGTARRRLADLLAVLIADLARGIVCTLAEAGPAQPDTQAARRDLLRRVIALDPAVDETIGESTDVRNKSLTLQAAIAGGFAALGAWRAVALRLRLLPGAAAQAQAATVLDGLAPALRAAAGTVQPATWQRDAARLRAQALASADRLFAIPTAAPSERLLANHAARALAGLAEAINGLALLVDAPVASPAGQGGWRLQVPDWGPALVNAGRSVVAIMAVQLLWIVTAWPGGGVAMAWVAIVTALFAPRADQAYAGAFGYLVGTLVSLSAAAILAFAVLPQLNGFPAFTLALAAYFIPAGVLMAIGWRPPVAIGMVGTMAAFLMPTNAMVYDSLAFYNNALALLIGNGAALAAFRLIPPIPAMTRVERLLRLSLRDLRGLALAPRRWSLADWEARLYSRLAALPDQAEPLQRARLLAALDLGIEMLRLRRVVSAAWHAGIATLAEADDLAAVFEAIAGGRSLAAADRLDRLDRRLAARSPTGTLAADAAQWRASMLAVSDLLRAHAAFFDEGSAR